jgi:histidinol phosphatase-like PHP family hydrolase
MNEAESVSPQTLATETNQATQSPEISKPPIRLREWLKVIAHTHSKLSGPEIETEAALKNYQDGQLTTKKLAEILAALGEKKGGFFLVDSDHAAHSLREYHPNLFPSKDKGEVRKRRRQAFQRENLPKTKDFLSRVILKRAEAIRALQERNQSLKGRIFTGVEVNILGPDGELDIEDEALRQLDYVGASFHRDEWIDTNGEKPAVEGLLDAYMILASHPAVDVINHPIRELPEEEWRKFEEEGNQYFKRWQKICQALARNGKAIEINLRDLIDPERKKQNQLYLKLIQEAKKAGVKFVLGTDFHRVEQYLQKGERREKLEELAKGDIFFEDQGKKFEEEIDQVLKEVFAEGEGAFGLPKNFVNLTRPIYRAIRRLTEIEITPDDILNGDEKRFRGWINLRRNYKNSTPILEKELEKRGCVVRSIRSILDEQGLYYLGIPPFERLSQLKTLDQWRDKEVETLFHEGRDFGGIVKRVEEIANEAY